MARPQKYPPALLTNWYQSWYPGDAMDVNTVLWHSTEGTSLPTYGGGASAPTLTAVPDFRARKIVWYQHFNIDVSARALVNEAGGVQTNTLNVCQVEIVGTCDPATHERWGSVPHLYMPQLPDWAVRDLGSFSRWMRDEHGVPLTSSVTFKAYPGSYGKSNGVRMSAAKWDGYKGHCGHQHAPENLHGDPGSLPMAAILDAARGEDTPVTNIPGKDIEAPKPLAYTQVLETDAIPVPANLPGAAEQGFWTLESYLRFIAESLIRIEGKLK